MSANHLHGVAGTVVQARSITGNVHLHTTTTPETSAVPWQLPAARLFLDRGQASSWLNRAWVARHGPMRVGVQGPSGVGKTALVTAWGHTYRDRWPDGALYTDLARTSPDTVLRGWLLALGQTHLPQSPDQLRALWRTATATRRLLIVVENTTCEAAEELFPAGADCAGIATAHHGLDDLVTLGGRCASLPGLPDAAVTDLITQLVDQPLPDPVLQKAVTASAGLPLAATLTAAALTRTLQPTLTEQEITVSARIDQILAELPEEAVTAAAAVAAFPGPSVSTDATAALLDTTPDQARDVLDQLSQARLLEEGAHGRYTVHDQVRAHLKDRLTPHAHARVLESLASFYRVRIAGAELILNPWRWRADTHGSELARAAQERDAWFATRAQALDWLDAELANILAAARLLHQHGRPEVWMICDHIGTYVVLRTPAAAQELYRWGVEAARATGDGRALGLMLQRLSTTVHPDWQAALDLNLTAKEAYEQADYTQGVASAYESIGTLLAQLDQLAEAEQAQTRSLHLHEQITNMRGAALQRRRLGEIHTRQGHTSPALAAFTSSYRTLLELDPPDVYQATRSAQGMIALLLDRNDPGQLPVVEMVALQALAAARICGSLVQEASVHLDLAALARARGQTAEEIGHLQRAHHRVPSQHPVAQKAAAQLAELGAPTH
ncbi:hypothetical protein [Nocardiopsis nanhaiensis]